MLLASIPARADGSTDRAAGSANSLFPRAPEINGRSASLQKKCGWPPAACPSLCRFRTSTPARASSTGAPCLRSLHHARTAEFGGNGTRNLCSLCCLCVRPVFFRIRISGSASTRSRAAGRGAREILHASAGYVRGGRRPEAPFAGEAPPSLWGFPQLSRRLPAAQPPRRPILTTPTPALTHSTHSRTHALAVQSGRPPSDLASSTRRTRASWMSV
jgi:hypothetical protein